MQSVTGTVRNWARRNTAAATKRVCTVTACGTTSPAAGLQVNVRASDDRVLRLTFDANEAGDLMRMLEHCTRRVVAPEAAATCSAEATDADH